MRFSGWVVVVTGGGRGIGRAAAELFAAEGAAVAVAEKEPAGDLPAGITASAVDVTQLAQVDAFMAATGARYGRIDTLVSNAGRPFHGTTLTATDDEWEECQALNLRATWHCARAAHPWLLKSEHASIVTVASAQGQRSGKTSFPYSAAKGGLLALTRSMAVEYAPRIRANAVIPGQVESVRTNEFFGGFRDPEQARRRVLQTFPMRRLGRPGDIAHAIAFLASDAAAWITGTWLVVDGGRDAALADLSDLR